MSISLGAAMLGAAGIGAVGSLIGGGINAHNAREQMAAQYEFAQNGVRWKVADAKAAGIHPLAALGAQTFSYNPVATGDYGVSEALGRMGQGVERAVHAKALAEERALDADLKKANINLLNAQTDAVASQAAASKVAVAQTAQVPSMPKVNTHAPQNDGRSITGGTTPLLSASRVANAIILHFNPDISDAITEDMAKNIATNVAAEAKAGKIMPELKNHLTKGELRAIANGDAELVYTPPLTFNFMWKNHMKPYTAKDGKSGGGRILYNVR